MTTPDLAPTPTRDRTPLQVALLIALLPFLVALGAAALWAAPTVAFLLFVLVTGL